MATKKKYKGFEEAIARLEEINDLLESGEAPLEESLKLYTEALDIVKFCNKKLSEAEKKIKVISEKDGQVTEIDLDDED